MKILILGIDGYIGWPLAMHLALRKHQVSGIDNFVKRKQLKKIGSESVLPTSSMKKRLSEFKKTHKKNIIFYEGDILNYKFLEYVLKKFRPDAIVHLAEQPSAPFSMIDRESSVYTQHNNVEGTLNVLYAIKKIVPDCHLVKLGTLGEYGTPNIEIPEGFFEISYRGKKDILPFPRQPGSIYHLSKVHDSANILFACRVWGIRSTDIMQGVVYGTRTKEMIRDSLLTMFYFDEIFGTAINRFCAQAVIEYPLTPYGKGTQKRGFIDVEDSIQCIRIIVEKPPKKGEYRILNQYDQTFSINELTKYVQKCGKKYGLNVKIKSVKNPRVEKESHYYKVEHEKLKKLGFKPTRTITQTIDTMLKDLLKYRKNLNKKKHLIPPKTKWN